MNLAGEVVGIIEARLNDLTALALTGSLPQNVNYALKSGFVTAFLETVPEISAKLKAPRPAKARPFTEVVEEIRPSVVLITVY